jgi:uncharacterized membrane protein
VAALRRFALAVARGARAWPFVTALVVVMAALFATIGHDSLAGSSRSVLHGLCAQRPSHSYSIGGHLLPFDARMTGIYTGSLAAWAVLALRGRLLAAGTPSRGVIAVLAAGVAALAFDGTNALLVDLALWHPWAPLNVTRYFTGFATGVALASLEVWLIGTSLWRMAANRPMWGGLRDLWWAPPAAIAGFALIRLDLAWTYAPIVIALLASAWLTVTGLTLVIVLAAFGLERKIASGRQLEPAVVAGAIAALAVIIGLAQLRFWLERTLGIPQDLVATVIVPLGSILP